MEVICQGLHELFRCHGLKTTINKIIANSLHVTLNMENGHYCYESSHNHKPELTAPETRKRRKPEDPETLPFNMSVTTNVGVAFL